MDDISKAMFTDVTAHALDAVIRVIDVWPDDGTKGDVYINLATNAGAMGCAEMVMTLAPDLAPAEGEAGVEREALRLWRRCCREIAASHTDAELSDRLYRVTRNFNPRFADGRSALLVVPDEKGGGDAS